MSRREREKLNARCCLQAEKSFSVIQLGPSLRLCGSFKTEHAQRKVSAVKVFRFEAMFTVPSVSPIHAHSLSDNKL